MIVDANLLLTASQTVTTDAAVTDTIALGKAGLDVGEGEPLALVFAVKTNAVSAGGETYSFRLRTATNSNGTTNAVDLLSTNAIAGTALTAGKRVVLPIPSQAISSTATHLAGYVDVTGAGASITFSAFVQPLSMIQGDVYYASGFTVQA